MKRTARSTRSGPFSFGSGSLLQPGFEIAIDSVVIEASMRLSLRKPSLTFFLTAGLASLVVSATTSPRALAHQHVSAIDGAEVSVSPPPELVRQARKMHRVIVQYGQRKSAVQERRILRALKGLPFEVVTRFQYSPSIVLNVDHRGLERLRAMQGVTIQFDEPVPPT